jgi:hypothetical protein
VADFVEEQLADRAASYAEIADHPPSLVGFASPFVARAFNEESNEIGLRWIDRDQDGWP